jgi:hypothetical protein
MLNPRAGELEGIMDLPMRRSAADQSIARPSLYGRPGIYAVASLAMLALAGCQTSTSNILAPIDKAQGSSENIGSLTSVIQSNPRDPEGYNVRGSAYGKAGRYKEALKDFDAALQLNPNFYQAYANRALIYRFMGEDARAVADYNRAIQITTAPSRSTRNMTWPISGAAMSIVRRGVSMRRSTISTAPSSSIRRMGGLTTIAG